MKKLISLLLACLMLASLSVASFADDSANYEQNAADLEAMADCIEAGTTKIELTDEYFTIPTTLYSHLGSCVKLSFQSRGENVDAAIFTIAPDNEFAAVISTQHKQNVSISSTEEEIEFISEQLYIGYGARLGINFLTSVEQDTTITVKVYAKNSSMTTSNKE